MATARRRAFLRHLARFVFGATLLGLSIAYAPITVVITGPYFFLGTFSFQHDLLHAALRLPRVWREPLLTMAGTTLFMSGHATRTMHLLHHRVDHGEEDLEGGCVNLPFWNAVARTPGLAVRIRGAAWRHSVRGDQKKQAFEHAANAGLVAVVLLSGLHGAYIYLGVAMVLQLTMPFWAGRIPHRVPAWGQRLAARIARLGSVTAMSLAYHERHHERPTVPTHLLAQRD